MHLWRVWLTGWDSTWTTQRWIYTPDLGAAADPVQAYLHWLKVHVAASTGPPIPSQSTATIIVTLAMLKQEKVLGHGVCLDENGLVTQVCTSPLGLRPSLCCCEHMIVGVDLLEGNWRLWNWAVFQHNKLHAHVSLEPTCQRAYVYPEPGTIRFWLIEELQHGVRITHREADTLTEIAPATYFPGAGLLSDQEETRPLNDYHHVGIIPYRETLLLLAKSANGELVLCQVR